MQWAGCFDAAQEPRLLLFEKPIIIFFYHHFMYHLNENTIL